MSQDHKQVSIHEENDEYIGINTSDLEPGIVNRENRQERGRGRRSKGQERQERKKSEDWDAESNEKNTPIQQQKGSGKIESDNDNNTQDANKRVNKYKQEQDDWSKVSIEEKKQRSRRNQKVQQQNNKTVQQIQKKQQEENKDQSEWDMEKIKKEQPNKNESIEVQQDPPKQTKRGGENVMREKQLSFDKEKDQSLWDKQQESNTKQRGNRGNRGNREEGGTNYEGQQRKGRRNNREEGRYQENNRQGHRRYDNGDKYQRGEGNMRGGRGGKYDRWNGGDRNERRRDYGGRDEDKNRHGGFKKQGNGQQNEGSYRGYRNDRNNQHRNGQHHQNHITKQSNDKQLQFKPKGQKSWPEISFYVKQTKIAFNFKRITEHVSDILVFPFIDLKFDVYPSTLINKFTINYREKIEKKLEEAQKDNKPVTEGWLYPQRCVGLANFKALQFFKISKNPANNPNLFQNCFNMAAKLARSLPEKKAYSILIPYSKQLGQFSQLLKCIVKQIENYECFKQVIISTNNGLDCVKPITAFGEYLKNLIQDNMIAID